MERERARGGRERKREREKEPQIEAQGQEWHGAIASVLCACQWNWRANLGLKVGAEVLVKPFIEQRSVAPLRITSGAPQYVDLHTEN
jgi:hypothetical protein